MVQVYIDAEFDAVRIETRFEQAVISFGAVACTSRHAVLDTFYTLVRPRHFKHLSPIVRRMTHLRDEEILAAKPFEEITKQFFAWLATLGDPQAMRFYSCGPDDRRTLTKNCRLHHIDDAVFCRIQDLQKIISSQVKLHERIIAPALSLDDMKLIYDVRGSVEHNALSDAIDLMHIHHRFIEGKANEAAILDIVKRKEAKQLEVRRRQNERLCKLMRERFSDYPQTFVAVPLYPEVIEQFQLWEDREKQTHMHWKRKCFVQNEQCYPYDDLQLWMKIDLQDTLPSITLRFLYHHEDIMRKYPLRYRNATMVEAILKRVLA